MTDKRERFFIPLFMASICEMYCEMWFIADITTAVSFSSEHHLHVQKKLEGISHLKLCYHMLVIQTHSLEWCWRQSFSLDEPYHLFEIQTP